MGHAHACAPSVCRSQCRPPLNEQPIWRSRRSICDNHPRSLFLHRSCFVSYIFSHKVSDHFHHQHDDYRSNSHLLNIVLFLRCHVHSPISPENQDFNHLFRLILSHGSSHPPGLGMTINHTIGEGSFRRKLLFISLNKKNQWVSMRTFEVTSRYSKILTIE